MGLKVIQLNAQHSRLAMVRIRGLFEQQKQLIMLVQEPWTVRGSVAGLGGDIIALKSEAASPRACILMARGTQAWVHSSYSDRDCVVVEMRLREGENLILVSVYMAHDELNPPRLLTSIVEEAEQRKAFIVVGGDANAHHEAWGSTGNNQRGNDLLDYLVSTNMMLVNRGNEPTFVTRSRREVLDITLVDADHLDRLESWAVVVEDSCSDHKMIQFVISDVEKPLPIYRRVPKNTDWRVYEEYICARYAPILDMPVGCVEDLNKLDSAMKTLISDAIKEACPLTWTNRKRRPKPWTVELTDMRKESRRAYRVALKQNTEGAWDEYRVSRRAYQAEQRRVSRSEWRAFCGECSSTSAIMRLKRILGRTKVYAPGMMRRPDGTFTTNPEEALDALLAEHFPGDDVVGVAVDAHLGEGGRGTSVGLITAEAVRAALGTFGSFKAPGPDGISPIHLQKGKEFLVPILVKLYGACLDKGTLPVGWRESRAIFIPKPGKASYMEPKAFRPICLTSFVLKTLERVIGWHLREVGLGETAMHNNQHAYRSGRSTETALHQLVGKVERSLDEGRFALAAFMDIEGAFSKVPVGSLMRGLDDFEVDESIKRFVGAMLRDRTVTATLLGVERSKTIGRGTPQGGVLSPLLWNMMINELLRVIGKLQIPVHIQAYADDVTILASGLDPETLRSHLNSSLEAMVEWCQTNGLGVNPSKTEVVMFTRNRKWHMGEVRLNGVVVPLRDNAKYLGLTLTSKLCWNKHIATKVDKARLIMAQCRRAVGGSWGLSPRSMHWIYTAIVRPILCYGALLWAPALKAKACVDHLQKIQRMACLCISGVMRSAPTAALEVALRMLPINIHAQMLARKTHLRLLVQGGWNPWWGPRRGLKTVGHVQWCGNTNEGMCGMERLCDVTSRHSLIDRRYGVEIGTRKAWMDRIHMPQLGPEDREVHCYTDGSRQAKRTGTGIIIKRKGAETLRRVVPLGSLATVYQAELNGISMAATLMREEGISDMSITIFCDNQACLRALSGSHCNSRQVCEGYDHLNRLAARNKVSLKWVPGHIGIEGNEEADLAAKEATEVVISGPEPFLPVPLNALNGTIHEQAVRQHMREWANRKDCRQAREWLVSYTKPRTAATMLNWRRSDLRKVMGVLTGHVGLNKHLHTLKVVESPRCGRCGLEETALHFMAKCQGYSRQRYEIFGQGQIMTGDVGGLSRVKVCKYIRATGRL
jgi:ribonuclease HI